MTLGLSSAGPADLAAGGASSRAYQSPAGRSRPPDDVQKVAGPVLGVRLGLDAESAPATLSEILSAVPVPV